MAGMLPAATGTDTGGSIRIPAAICGVVGIKPTYGRISLRGIIPLSSSLDHPGPMARSVEDCAILLGAMSGYDPGDSKSIDSPIPDYRRGLNDPVNGLTAGVPREFFSKLQPGVRAAVETAITTLEDLGIAIRDVDVPTIEEAWSISSKILGVEAAAYHHKWMNERPEEYDPQVLQRLQSGATVSAVDYILAQQLRDDFSQRYRDSLQGVDVLVSPTEPITATVIGEDTVLVEGDTEPTLNQLVSLTRPHNLTGMPSMSVPCGFDEQGLPTGLQIAGKHFDEATVLRVAYAYEQATDWHSHRPTL